MHLETRAIPSRTGIGSYQASFGQERLWLLDRLHPGGTSFNMPFPLRLRGTLDQAALARALDGLVERHASLRTTFAQIGLTTMQVVHPPGSVNLELIDLEGLPAAEREAEARRRIDLEGRTPFDLEKGPLYRASLIRLGDDHHLLLQNLHHIISDGWSTGVLFSDLRELLAAETAMRPHRLEPLALQYADFGLWQRGELEGERLSAKLDYWRRRLRGATPSLALPTDRPRPKRTGERNSTIELSLDAAFSEPLRQLATRHGASLFILLLTGFKVLLHRLSGQEDIVVGSPIAGRLRRETENLVGFFLNTLVLRTQVEADRTFRELLLAVRETVLGATEHQDLPFEKLIIELQPERHLGQTPFFQVFFNMANIPDLQFELPGLEVEMLPIPEIGSKFDLNFYVFENAGHLDIRLVYNPDLFDRARVRVMSEQYYAILVQALADPETCIGDFDLLTVAAKRTLPNPRAPLGGPWPGSVVELFAARAKAQPTALALVEGESAITYSELQARQDQLAAQLAALGVERGEVVAIWARRSALLPIALLGILRRGAAFMILDPAYPPRRIAEYLTLAKPKAAILLAGADGVPPEVSAVLPQRRLELGWEQIDQKPAAATLPAREEIPLGPESLAYYAFTSGSTGKPKAILGAHGSLSAFLPFLVQRFELGPGDRQSMASALSHDPLQRDVFISLCLGMTLVVPDEKQLLQPSYLGQWARQQRITVMNLVPAMLQLLCRENDAEAPFELPHLRFVFTVGEVLKRSEVSSLYAIAQAATCVNLYGATETQRALSYLEVPRETSFDSESEGGPHRGSDGLDKAILPLGRGMDGAQLLVLNSRRRLAGIGELGEICFRSPYLALGYADEEQTRERFESNPFGASDANDRIYHSGDLGRYLPGGGVEFAGRSDFQVKIRGFRIELQEIEAALLSHSQIAAVVVVLRDPEAESGGQLVAYFEPKSESPPEVRELRAFLLDFLPDYMVPQAFVAMDALPRNQAGKIDRSALPAPTSAPEISHLGRKPTTPEQEILAALYGQLLGREQIFLDDHFFELGGHSLLATQLLARVRDAFGVSLPLEVVFEKPRVENLAAALMQAQRGDAPKAQVLLTRLADEARKPLSFSQERLYFIEKLEPGQGAYVLAGALRLRGRLEIDKLQAAFERIVRRHQSLRTRFLETEDGEPFQLIDPPGEQALPLLDLSSLPSEDVEAQVAGRAAALSNRGFDLARDPMLRTELLRLSDEEHILLIAIHHIVADGWSLGILVKELAAFYKALLCGDDDPLPSLPLQYSDFAAWQRRRLTGVAMEEGLAFWKDHLRGAPSLLTLPTDAPRPAMQSFAGSSYELELGGALSEDLRRFAHQHGLTPFMVLLAAFSALLGRLSGQDDVVVGAPIAGRQLSEVEGLIGFFANTLALRSTLAAASDFLSLCKQIRRTALAAYAHQEVPFERLVAELEVPRDLGHSPIFQVMIALQNVPYQEVELGPLEIDTVELGRKQALFDLSLILLEHSQGLHARLEYNTDLFLPERARQWAGAFERLLRQAIAEPTRALASLDLLTGEERQALLRQASATDDHLWQGGPLQRIRRFIERYPDLTAIEDGPRRLTYGELGRRSRALAARLRRLGVSRQASVALVAERSLESVVAQLAVLEAGAFFVPLLPSLPAARLRFILQDLACAALLTTGGAPFEDLGLPLLELGEALFAPDPGGTARLADEVWPLAEELAYAIYTSGSTGLPKGVGGLHGAVECLLEDLDARLPIAPGTRCAWSASPQFDVSIGEVFGCLARGGTLLIAPEVAKGSAEAYADWLSQAQVAIAEWPAPFLAELLSWLREDHGGKLALEAIRVGTEAISLPLLEDLRRELAQTRVLNYYGPTETTVECTVFEIPPEAADHRPPREGKAPIGQALLGVRTYVVDRHFELVLPGVFGELLIGGGGLTRGYLGRPRLTAERFLPDPFSQRPGARLYRSGDLVRQLPSGDLEFAGRIDDQLKIRGFRIEPGEIEAVLASHEAVRDQLVLAQSSPGQTPILVAYIACGLPGEKPELADLRRFLGSRLPDYLIPGAFVLLDELPRSANGKVDRKALPPWRAKSSSKRRATYPYEVLLARIFAEVLELEEEPGTEDNFFHLGGHSLLATRLLARIRRQLGVELPLREIFQQPTLASLAARLGELRATGNSLRLPPLTRKRRRADDTRLASFGEQRMFFLQSFDPESAVYVLRSAFEMTGLLRVEAFEKALLEILRRHEILRSTYHLEGSELRVRLGSLKARCLELRDLEALPEAEREAQVAAQLAAEAKATFDLEKGPLYRFRLLRLGPERHLFCTAIHHIAFDGWSQQLLMRELEQLYEAFASDRPSPLAAPQLQYADFAAWQRSWLEGAELERQLDFWRRYLSGNESLELPTEGPRPAIFSYRGEAVPWRLPADIDAALRPFLLAEGSTAFMALAGAWQSYLAVLTGQQSVSLGSPIDGRNTQELENTIGFFANTLVLRTKLGDDPTFRQALARMREAAIDAFSHQDVPFEKLVDSLDVTRDASRNPIFQAGFQVLDRRFAGERLAGLELEPVAAPHRTSRFDLDLQLFDDGSAFSGALVFNTDLFSRQTVEAWLAGFETFLEAALASPDTRLGDLPRMPVATRNRLLELPETAKVVAADLADSTLELFFAQARRSPQATALAFGGEELSYGELASRVERLALQLVGQGLEPETRVGVLLERDLDLPLALLAVWRAGAAYVPLDPSYPAERLRFMVEAAGCRKIVSRGGLAGLLGTFEGVDMLDLDTCELPASGVGSRVLPPCSTAAASLAYVLFTSGSTGKPKGVMVSHGNLSNFLLSMAQQPGLGSNDVLVSVTTASFDIFGLELYLPLIRGAKVVLASRETAADGEALARLIETSAASCLQATPATWRLLLDSGWRGWPGLRALCGGEALPGELAARLIDLGCELWNVYGPTETTIWSTLHAVTREDTAGIIPLGSRIANTSLHVVDRHGRLVPPGIPGELLIGGEGVARGYWGQPRLTAERFVPDPWATQPGARAYRTGDLVRRRSRDLELEFLGRVDHQVKVRGFRIELGEIEAAIASLPGIDQAVVLARQDGPGAARLIGYWTQGPGESSSAHLGAGAIEKYLRSILPEYMVPVGYVRLDRWPLTSNGKIDRKALPAPDLLQKRGAGRQPETAAQKALAVATEQVLRVKSPSLDDNFFHLGGDSILVIQVISRLRKEGWKLKPRDFFIGQTLEEIADLAIAAPEGGHEPPQVEPPARMAGIDISPDIDLCEEDFESLLDSIS